MGDVRLHLSVLREDQTGQQGGALLGGQRTQNVLKEQLGEEQLVAAYLTGHAAFQLHCSAAVDILELLQHLRAEWEHHATVFTVAAAESLLPLRWLMPIQPSDSFYSTIAWANMLPAYS